MNVIISNKYKDILNSLDVDVSKNMNGEFTVDEIIHSFSNFFFNRMFLDITAIKDHTNLQNIQKLSMNIDMSKVILFLDDDNESSSPSYLSQLISLGIYNFTRNREGLMYLYNHPNSYRDVAHIHQINNQIVEQEVKSTPSTTLRILGIKNITNHAGATTLIYMLRKQLLNHYNVIAIEVNKRDFIFFNDRNLISTTEEELPDVISKHKDADIILIDLNDSNDALCSDVLYLIEPTTIKLNRMIMLDKKIFDKLANKKIVLNKSLLETKDILDFEFESSSKVYYNLPPLNDKSDNSDVLLPFLDRLGFVKRIENKENDNKIFGLFKF